MKAWIESPKVIEIAAFDQPAGFAMVRLDSGQVARVWHYRLRKLGVLPPHGIPPALPGSYVMLGRAPDGGLNVEAVHKFPRYAFQASGAEMEALVLKLRAGEELAEGERAFVEAVLNLERNGDCRDRVTWLRFKAEFERALPDARP